MTSPRFACVVIDVDSTLCGLEGIDWLAARRGPEVAAAIGRLTERSMAGEIPLEAVYHERLSLVRPTAAEVALLADAYLGTFAEGARGVVARLRTAGVRVILVSGGLRAAILPVARELELTEGDVHAVELRFTADGEYAGVDERSPLATQEGKRTLVEALELPEPVLAVGDGATDLAMRPAVAAFAAFTGFVRRAAVVQAADLVVASFHELEELVLS